MDFKMRFVLPYFVLSIILDDVALSQILNCANPADIMFLLDGSDSIDAQEWNQERNFVARMVNDLDISPSTIHAGFTVYSSVVNKHFGLTPFRPKIVLNAMARSLAHPTGIATNTATGILTIRDEFRNAPRRNAPKIMIVITDGSSENPAETIRQAQLAKEEGIRIIAVGIGNNVFVEELQQIASNPQKFYRAIDFAALRGIEADIRKMICKVITTTPVPRSQFVPPTMPPDLIPKGTDQMCNVPGDIVFVIDGSNSISDADYVRLKNFVARLIEHFEIGPNAIHVGMIVYSTLVGETIGLYPPKNKMVLKFLANNLEHPKFGTDTAAGIEAARNMIREQGRPDAPEIIIVITDGKSVYPRNTVVQASIAKAQGITMIAIGVGTDIFSEELNQIASGANFVSEVADFTALANTVNLMRTLICTSITTTAPVTTSMLPPTPPPSIDPPPSGLICNVPGDVVFLLDGSDSIASNDWIRQKNFVVNLINNLEIGQPYIHVAVVVYSSQIGQTVQLIPFKPKMVLNRLVADLPQPKFGTDTALGIQEARKMLKTYGRVDAPKVIIVVTDGKSTFPDNTMIQANMAKADGVTMISVGVGSDIYADELQNIATSMAQVFKVIDFASLKDIIGSLRNRICQVVQTTTMAPITTPVPTPPPTTTTQMTTPMSVPLYPCPESETSADIQFLIDGSKTISPYNWMMETHFVSNFLDGLHIRPQFSHVGVVISDHVRGDSIGITPFKDRFHLKELIHGLMHPSGDMDTAMGIRKIRDIFTRQGRRNAQRVVIVVTDGSSRNMAETIFEANKLKELGAEVVSVGVGNNVNAAEITALASNPRYALRTGDVDVFFNMLPTLQNIVCSILRKPETTTMATTTPGLCDGCLVDKGIGFNPFPGDCTKYVQCWKDGDTVRALVRSCPFGQFWDADAITCRPSFLVRCTADPCLGATPGYTYGMSEYGCRAYWKCIDGFSVGHCCPKGSSYVEGMGCLSGSGCNEDCPPRGGIAVKPTCHKKVHWDKRYYIEIIYGRGEMVRPCPVGTIFFEDKCACDFGLSGLLPTTPDVLCHPSAFFSFDSDLKDKSMNLINTGVTNVRLTDLGTAYFNGRSEMNMWRFAGADWGNTLVIKFKFRFDYSNKFIDYGGLPVDMGVDFNVNMNLVSDYRMTDNDWRLWNQLINVRTLNDWRQLLREFGRSKTFYIFLGQLGFKPGTSNSEQVVKILGTREAYAEFRALLQRMQPHLLNNINLNDKSTSGLKDILSQLRSMRQYINWDNIVGQLTGQTGSKGGQNGGGSTDTTTVITGGKGQWPQIDNSGGSKLAGNGEWRWDTIRGEWVKVTGSGSGASAGGTLTSTNQNALNIAGTGAASEWHFNSATGQWERLAAVHTGNLGKDGVQISSGTWNSGTRPGGWSNEGTVAGSGTSWRWQAGGSARPITTGASSGSTSQFTGTGSTGTAGSLGSGHISAGGSFTEQSSTFTGQIEAGRSTAGAAAGFGGGLSGTGSFTGHTGTGGSAGGTTSFGGGLSGTGSFTGQTGSGGSAGGTTSFGEGLIGTGSFTGQTGAGGLARGTTSFGGGLSGTGSFTGQTGAVGSAGGTTSFGRGLGGAGSFTGQTGASGVESGLGSWTWQDILREMQKVQNASSSGTWKWNTMANGNGGANVANQQAIEALLSQLKLGRGQNGNVTWQWSSKGLSNATGGANDVAYEANRLAIEALLNQLKVGRAQDGSAVWQWSGTGLSNATGGAYGGANEANRLSIEALLRQLNLGGGQQGSTSWQWSSTGGTATGSQPDTKQLEAILKEMQTSAAKTQGVGSGWGNLGTSGQFITSSGQTAEITGGMGSNTGSGSTSQTQGGGSKITVQQKTEFAQPKTTETVITGGRVVGGSFGGSASQFGGASGGGSASTGLGLVQETSSRRSGGQGQTSGQFIVQPSEASWQRGPGGKGTVVSMVKQTVQGRSEQGIPDRSAPRGPNARGVPQHNMEGQIIGLHIPNQSSGFVSRATVSGAGSGIAGGEFTQMGKVVGSGGGVKRIIDTNVKRMPAGSVHFGADGGVSLESLGLGGAEGANIIRHSVRVEPAGNAGFVDQSAAAGATGVSGGQWSGSTSGASSGSGGGGFMSASALGHGSSGGQWSGGQGRGGFGLDNTVGQGVGGSSSSDQGGFISASTLGHGSSGGQWSGSQGGFSSDNNLRQGGGAGQGVSMTANLQGQQNSMLLPFLLSDSSMDILEGIGKKRRKRSVTKSRSKRAVQKLNYQALVTNCQGQNGQGPSIMVVGNQNDVQFAIKTYGSAEPGVVSVPAVEGWNDVTLIYDGSSLTGIVENWKGFHKSSVTLSGNIERRQAGLLVGSCQGYASFHGEMDDLSVHQCLTPAMQELRDRVVV